MGVLRLGLCVSVVAGYASSIWVDTEHTPNAPNLSSPNPGVTGRMAYRQLAPMVLHPLAEHHRIPRDLGHGVVLAVALVLSL